MIRSRRCGPSSDRFAGVTLGDPMDNRVMGTAGELASIPKRPYQGSKLQDVHDVLASLRSQSTGHGLAIGQPTGTGTHRRWTPPAGADINAGRTVGRPRAAT